ncbi:MAG: Fe-S protein assembly co-chaperone HscB [Porticoccaceae bacterium]
MDITSNYFEVFGLPVLYRLDQNLLADRYRNLQRQFHPDRYADKPAREQRLAEQYAAVLNQAYTELKSPLLRAQYLLSLNGLDGSGESAVTRDPVFLMEQMALRESLAEVRDSADPFAALQLVADEAREHYFSLQESFAQQLARDDLEGAKDTVAKMQFFSKLLDEVKVLEHEIDE